MTNGSHDHRCRRPSLPARLRPDAPLGPLFALHDQYLTQVTPDGAAEGPCGNQNLGTETSLTGDQKVICCRDIKRRYDSFGQPLSSPENRPENAMEKVHEIYIRTTPERLWEAITDPKIRSRYQLGSRISSDFMPGSRFEITHPGAPGPLDEGRARAPQGSPGGSSRSATAAS